MNSFITADFLSHTNNVYQIGVPNKKARLKGLLGYLLVLSFAWGAFETTPISGINYGSGKIKLNFSQRLLNCFNDPGRLGYLNN